MGAADGGDRVLVIKGDSRAPALSGRASPIEVGPLGAKLQARRQSLAGELRDGKEELYRWLRLERPTDEDLEQGVRFRPAIATSREYSEEYFKQITAEQLVTRVVKGYRRLEWQKMRERNEALDCRVYARAAAAVYGMDRFQEDWWRPWSKLAQAVIQVSPSPFRCCRRGKHHLGVRFPTSIQV